MGKIKLNMKTFFAITLITATQVQAFANHDIDYDLDNYKTINELQTTGLALQPGEAVHLRVDEFPSTGYTWNIGPSCDGHIEIQKDFHVESNSDRFTLTAGNVTNACKFEIASTKDDTFNKKATHFIQIPMTVTKVDPTRY